MALALLFPWLWLLGTAVGIQRSGCLRSPLWARSRASSTDAVPLEPPPPVRHCCYFSSHFRRGTGAAWDGSWPAVTPLGVMGPEWGPYPGDWAFIETTLDPMSFGAQLGPCSIPRPVNRESFRHGTRTTGPRVTRTTLLWAHLVPLPLHLVQLQHHRAHAVFVHVAVLPQRRALQLQVLLLLQVLWATQRSQRTRPMSCGSGPASQSWPVPHYVACA